MNKHLKKGFTLTEIMLAVVLMAFTFLPIIGIMSSSMKLTEKDGATQKAVALCQEKLSTALQMPFEIVPVGVVKNTITYNNGAMSLVLGDQTIGGVTYTSVLTSSYETVTFTVPECDYVKKSGAPGNPSSWFTSKKHSISNLVKRYTVSVSWKDRGETDAKKVKTYTLSSLKANLRR